MLQLSELLKSLKAKKVTQIFQSMKTLFQLRSPERKRLIPLTQEVCQQKLFHVVKQMLSSKNQEVFQEDHY